MRSSSVAAETEWVVAQTSIIATIRPRIGFLCLCMMGAKPSGSGGTAAPPEVSACLLLGDASAAGHSIDGAVVIVGDQHRAVLHGKQVDRPPNIVVVLDETGDERLHRPEAAIAIQLDDHDVATDLHA